MEEASWKIIYNKKNENSEWIFEREQQSNGNEKEKKINTVNEYKMETHGIEKRNIYK